MPHRYLYLLRHGQYQTVKRDDGTLTERGIQQAQVTAETLKDIPFSAIHHSTIIRAQQTAEIIAELHPNAPLCPTDLLRECVPSIPMHMTGLFSGNHIGTSPDEMSLCTNQMQTLMDTHFIPPEEDDTYELLVCHGNVIRYLMGRVLNVDASAIWLNMLIHNCGISRVMIDHRHIQYLVSHNDIGHLPETLRTHN